MNTLDLIIIIVYAASMLGLGYFFKEQKSTEDYFLGGKSFGWFELGLSTMASQLSAVSFISAAAFVGLRPGGGMQWLTFEFAVPLAMIFLIIVLIPPLYKSGVVSIYAFLEKRFGRSTRVLVSLVFQFSRAFATGIMIYTMALVLAAVMDIPMWQTILVTGIITIIYSYQGGMKAVVWGDTIQMFILFGGIVVCIFYGLNELGGWSEFVGQLDRDRLNVMDMNWGLSKGEEFGVLPMILGGFFLYTSYYGCDQSQAQRSLSGKSLKEVQRALLFNGLFRFPVTLTYCIMGLVVGTLAFSDAEFMAKIPAERPDFMIPVFIVEKLPHGIIGLLLVAILAAAMSSLSSAINSLSAATVEDLLNNSDTEISEEKKLKQSKMMTLFWGVVCLGLAFVAGDIAKTVIEAINKVGSAFYGPILTTFVLAIFSKKITTTGINIGILSGVAFNVFLWLGTDVFWIWMNLTGVLVTLIVALLVSYLVADKSLTTFANRSEFVENPKNVRTEIVLLLGFFVLLLVISASLGNLF
jgi:SSS family transporter